MTIRTAQLRHRVRIEEPNLVDNGGGGRRVPPGGEKWRLHADRVAAEVVAVRGSVALEHLVARKLTIWRVTMHSRAGLRPDMRLVHGDIVMAIRAIVPTDARDGLVLTCESGGAG